MGADCAAGGTADALRDAIGVELDPVDRTFREHYLVAARGKLDKAELAAAQSEWRALTLEQALSVALEDPMILASGRLDQRPRQRDRGTAQVIRAKFGLCADHAQPECTRRKV